MTQDSRDGGRDADGGGADGDDERRFADEEWQDEKPNAPLFNAPKVVIWLALAFLAIHLVVQFSPDTLANQIIMALAFIPVRFVDGGNVLPGGDIARVTSFVSYGFLHGDWMHLAVNSFWMLAFGSVAARRLGTWRFLAFSALAAAVAALFSLLVNWHEDMVLVGASGAIAGQMAITVRLIFANGGTLRTAMQRDMSMSPPEPLWRLFTNRSAVVFLIIWISMDVLFAGSGLLTGNRIAWEAHLGGLITGLLAFSWFDPLKPAAVTRAG